MTGTSGYIALFSLPLHMFDSVLNKRIFFLIKVERGVITGVRGGKVLYFGRGLLEDSNRKIICHFLNRERSI